MSWFASKLLLFLTTLIGASLIAFFLIRLIPGDPVLNMLGERGGTEEQVADIKARLGFDRSLPEQYIIFVSRALRGDLGQSVVSERPVTEEFLDRMPATLELGLAGLFWATVFGIPLGLLAALKRNTFLDYGVMGVSLVGYSMPIFWWGLLLILLFSVKLGWFPVSGRLDIVHDVPAQTGFLLIDVWLVDQPFETSWMLFKNALQHLFLPALVLGTIPLALIARITRASLLEILQEDYIRTAKAMGIPPWKQIGIYALRNCLVPLITVLGLLVGSLLTGAVLTETIFSWPGVGRWLVKSIEARDYPVVQGGILYTSLAIVIVNIVVDALYVWANPRLRRS
jgi:dipeptide transport system permease protein